MNCEEALKFIDALVFAKTGKHLSDLQRLLFEGSWKKERLSYKEMAKTYGYSASYFKQDVGPKLWQLLSEVCEEKVCKTNFRAAILRQAQLSGFTIPNFPDTTAESDVEKTITQEQNFQTHQYQDWGEAPDVTLFYNRTKELNQLGEWLCTEHCRLITLLGMGGIGKTYLSVKLAEGLQNEFNFLIFRSLSHAPLLQEILTNLLQILSKGQELDLPVTVDEKISKLIDYFRKYRCLLLLDNTETILLSGEYTGNYKENYEDYGKFFKRLGECVHNSCLVLTSREKPPEIALMEGKTLPVRCLHLKGLSVEAGLKLLQIKGCHWHSERKSSLLVKRYSGNPLALKIVAAMIQELFGGNLSEFIQHNTFVLDEIRTLLEEHFERLSDLGKIVLYWLGINIESVSIAQLHTDIFPQVSKSQLIETIKSLVWGSLIEKSDNHFLLQPVVREYLLSKLIEQVVVEIKTGDLVLLNILALLKANTKDYIRTAQKEFIIKPVVDRLMGIFKTQDNLEKRLKQIISKLQRQSPREPGYGAGNILNIMGELQTDLSGADFSHLTVWQAYLQNLQLHESNFAYSDLSESVFPEHLTNILSIAFSPDGQLLATGDASGEIRLWQIANHKLLLICKGHAGWIHSISFSPDSKLLSSGSSDQTIKLWNVSDGKCLKTFSGHNQRVRSVAFSPDGRTLVSSSSDYSIRLWDVDRGKCLKVFSGHTSYIWSVSFSPDGKTIASGSEDRSVKVWDIHTGECLKTLQGHTLWVRSVAFSPDGRILASGGGDRTVRLWDVDTSKCLHTLQGHTQRIRQVAFSPDGRTLASGGGDHTIRLWDWSKGLCQKTLHGHSSRLGAIAFSPDSKILASGGEDRAIKLWEVNTGQCLKTWQGYASWIQSVAFSPNGKILASGSEDKKVRLWDIRSKKSVAIFEGHAGWVCSVAFSPDGKILASASSDYSIKLWDVSTQRCLKTLLGHTRWIRSVAFSPDGSKLASGSGDYTLKLWNPATGRCLKTLSGHRSWLWSVAFSPDGRTIASGSEDKTVKLWDVDTGECLRTFEGHNSWVQSVVFSPDGQTIASGSCDRTIKLWDVETGECLRTFWGHNSWVQSVVFSPDGQTIASGSCDQAIKLWDVSTGLAKQTLWKHDSWVWSVVFSPDGKTLASGSQDETIKLWDIKTGRPLGTLRSQRPLEGMCIQGVKGLTEAQLDKLKANGAVEKKRTRGFETTHHNL